MARAKRRLISFASQQAAHLRAVIKHATLPEIRFEDSNLNAAAAERAIALLSSAGVGAGIALRQLAPLLWAFGKQVSKSLFMCLFVCGCNKLLLTAAG